MVGMQNLMNYCSQYTKYIVYSHAKEKDIE